MGQLNINALMTVAVTGAFVIGQWPEAAMVMALYAIAELIEARAVDRRATPSSGLLAMALAGASRGAAGDGSWVASSGAAVHLGRMVRVKPGERVPLDGVVTAGHSAINQAPVTGESMPVDKARRSGLRRHDQRNRRLECRVTALASNTTLARIIHAVEEGPGHARAHAALRRPLRRDLHARPCS
jgi:Cd2+/Zn2+-exporting ATPase